MTISASAGSAATSPLVVRTTRIADPGPLVDQLRDDAAMTAWIRRGDGLVGWGCAAKANFGGEARFDDAHHWWSNLSSHAVVRDEVNLPGTGLVGFGTFAFADQPGASMLTVPEVLIGRRAGEAWMTHVGINHIGTGAGSELAESSPPQPPSNLTFDNWSPDQARWRDIVAQAVQRIKGGGLEKVVLARAVRATTAAPLDVRWPLSRLEANYPTCWTFHVDGLFGATPELLVRRERGLVTSRVLAGTIRRSGDDAEDMRRAATLARSSKDLEEHEYAVRSVAEALSQHCTSVNVPDAPFVLHLPNVMHLATDVAGVADDDASALELAASLHPSAAVGGTPTLAARQLIAEIEGLDRGRYAGPVGWIDGAGDGEWGLALRCAQVEGDSVRLFAGCGIVADSEPDAEVAESQAKFVPVYEALSS